MTVHDRTRLIGPLGNFVDAATASAGRFGAHSSVAAIRRAPSSFGPNRLSWRRLAVGDGVIGVAILVTESIDTGFAVLLRLFVAVLDPLRGFVGQLFYFAIEC